MTFMTNYIDSPCLWQNIPPRKFLSGAFAPTLMHCRHPWCTVQNKNMTMSINRIKKENEFAGGYLTCDLCVFELEIKITSSGQFGAVSEVRPVCEQRRPLVLLVGTAADEVKRLRKFLQSQLCCRRPLCCFHVGIDSLL